MASQLFKATEMKYTMTKSIDAIVDQQIQTNPLLKTKQTEYRRLMHDILKWEKLEPKYISLYNKYYSEKEMADLIKFHNTPLGKKMTRITPELTAETTKISEELMK